MANLCRHGICAESGRSRRRRSSPDRHFAREQNRQQLRGLHWDQHHEAPPPAIARDEPRRTPDASTWICRERAKSLKTTPGCRAAHLFVFFWTFLPQGSRELIGEVPKPLRWRSLDPQFAPIRRACCFAKLLPPAPRRSSRHFSTIRYCPSARAGDRGSVARAAAPSKAGSFAFWFLGRNDGRRGPQRKVLSRQVQFVYCFGQLETRSGKFQGKM